MFANGATGWQATSTALERVMLATAEEAGVRVERAMLTPEEAAARPAAMRLDCTGRAGVLARSRAGRRLEEGHRTVSLSAVWERPDGWGLPDASHTLIESYADGWAWSVPLDDTRRAVAVMVDPRITSMKRGDGAAATYRAELDKTGRLRALLADASMLGGPTGWDASMYSSTTYAGDDWLVVGDAASFVDPLSSAGVKKALASGWLAAIVTHTALSTPGMAGTARQFFADREAEVYANFLSLTRGYLHEAAEGQAHPFWSERAEAGERDALRAAAEREREAVQAAFERLKAAPELIARRGAERASGTAAGDRRQRDRDGAAACHSDRFGRGSIPSRRRCGHDGRARADLPSGSRPVRRVCEARRPGGPRAVFVTALATAWPGDGSICAKRD